MYVERSMGKGKGGAGAFGGGGGRDVNGRQTEDGRPDSCPCARAGVARLFRRCPGTGVG